MKSKKTTASSKLKPAGRGLNIFYYGKGKGKTTAVMGLAARAAGAGMRVFILQFVKSKPPKKGVRLQSGEWPQSSEILFFERADRAGVGKIKAAQTGAGFVGILGDRKERAVHISEAKKGLKLARALIRSGSYDLIILDELVSALELKLITEKDILSLLAAKPANLNIAYTGHDFFRPIVAVSDIASEIKMVRHPYYQGVLARRGIDF